MSRCGLLSKKVSFRPTVSRTPKADGMALRCKLSSQFLALSNGLAAERRGCSLLCRLLT